MCLGRLFLALGIYFVISVDDNPNFIRGRYINAVRTAIYHTI